jgi:hypothetical protein
VTCTTELQWFLHSALTCVPINIHNPQNKFCTNFLENSTYITITAIFCKGSKNASLPLQLKTGTSNRNKDDSCFYSLIKTRASKTQATFTILLQLPIIIITQVIIAL